ncbi:MAG: EAL domain-containing protein [Acidimicrobiales bacterium]
MHQLANSTLTAPVVVVADELARAQRSLARRESPASVARRLLAALAAATGASAAGIRVGEGGEWLLPEDASATMSGRLDRVCTAPGAHDWVIDVPIIDDGEPLGRFVLVVPSGTGAARGGLGVDSAQVVQVVTMLLIALGADAAPAAEATPARQTPLAAGMTRDLAAGRFVPHFQPVVDLASGTVAAFDALVRWNHPQRGWVSAAEFFPQAVKAGLASELDSVVFRQAAIRARGWLDRGAKRVRINVKVAGSRFESPELLDELRQLLRQHRLPAASVGLMIREKTLLRPSALAALPAMRDAGFRITLEHFGTQTVTPSSLSSVPLYALKIDHSIVRRLGADSSAARAARTVVNTARSLGLRTIGEGVETEAQCEALAELGCDAGQGFLWSPAVEAEVADSIMRFQTFQRRDRGRQIHPAGRKSIF